MEVLPYSKLLAPTNTPLALDPLLRPKSRPVLEARPAGIADYWQTICNRKAAIFGATLLSALVAALLTIPQAPLYQAQTSIELQGLNENFLHMNEITPNAGLYSTDGYLQTQVDILQSRSLLRRAAQKANLIARLNAARHAAFPLFRGPRIQEAGEPGEKTIKEILKRLKVRTSPPTRIIRIVFDSPDPRLAADFANALAVEYVSQTLESRWTEGQNTSEWLSHIQEDLKGRLQRSEDRLQNYMRNAGLMFLADNKGSVAEERLRQLQEELSKAQAERIARQSEYEVALSGKLDALPRVLDSVGLGDTQVKLTGLRVELAELSHILTPQHYRVQRLKVQIDELQSEFEKGRANILKRIKNENEQAEGRERLLEAACAQQRQVVADQAQKAVQYGLLKHEVDSDRALYDAMLQRVREASIASAVRTSNVRVIDPADPPAKPYKPDLLINTALGALTGLSLGLVFVSARENRDRRVRRPGEARIFSNTRELGVVPFSRGSDLERELVADSMHSMLTSLQFTGAAPEGPSIIVISSPGPGEGKTTIVRQLGCAIGDVSRRVLLVDGDRHRPRLHALFGISNSFGLNTLLQDAAPVEEYPPEALGTRCGDGLYVLPSGPRCEGGRDALYSPFGCARLAKLLARLRRQFDVVIVDTPPLLECPDARVFGRLCDGVILVIRAGLTSTEAVGLCTERLQEDGSVVLGTVLNACNASTSSYGYYRRRSPAAD
jgi:succinoglycan biosynthesis transport protein ExoP